MVRYSAIMSRSFYIFLIAFILLLLFAFFGRPDGKNPVSPTDVSSESPQTSEEEQTQTTETSQVHIFLVALEDRGENGREIGCGDSVVPVTRSIAPTTTPLRVALEELLSLKSQTDDESGLYNALYQSDLSVDKAEIVDSRAEIALSGTYRLGGTCDAPRFSEQLRETVGQFEGVTSVTILLNGVPIDEALSEG